MSSGGKHLDSFPRASVIRYTSWLVKITKFIFSQFCKLEVQNQGVHQADSL